MWVCGCVGGGGEEQKYATIYKLRTAAIILKTLLKAFGIANAAALYLNWP